MSSLNFAPCTLPIKCVNPLIFFKAHANIITHILLPCQQQTDSKASTPHRVLPHSYLYTSYSGKMSIILETQSPLISGHMLPLPVVRMSSKCNFCSSTLFHSTFLCVPALIPFQLLSIYAPSKGEGSILIEKMDYINLRASLSLPPVSRNGISPDLSFLT